jgi:hypothetical protein
MYYIVDTYNPYERNKDVVYRFEFNGIEWCIRQVDKFKWGKPQFDELPLDDTFIDYKIYDSLDEAIQFCKVLKGVNI